MLKRQRGRVSAACLAAGVVLAACLPVSGGSVFPSIIDGKSGSAGGSQVHLLRQQAGTLSVPVVVMNSSRSPAFVSTLAGTGSLLDDLTSAATTAAGAGGHRSFGEAASGGGASGSTPVSLGLAADAPEFPLEAAQEGPVVFEMPIRIGESTPLPPTPAVNALVAPSPAAVSSGLLLLALITLRRRY